MIEVLESVIEESDEVKITSQKLFSELTNKDCNLFSACEKQLLEQSKEAFESAEIAMNKTGLLEH